MIFKSEIIGFILVSLLGRPVYAQQCSDIFSHSRLIAPDFIQFIQPRLGGSEKQWLRFVNSLLVSRTPEELAEISDIFRQTETQSWFSRTANSVLFFRMDAIFSTIDSLYMKQINLKDITQWSYLSISERRALLLLAFNKWWWQVESPHVMGFSKWADFSFVVSRFVNRGIPETSLELRLHELLMDPSQVGFFSSLLGRFRSEYETLQVLRNDSEGREILSETLQIRVEELAKLRADSSVGLLKRSLLDLLIIRSLVLKDMLRLQRSLSLIEIQLLADQWNIPRKTITGSRVGQTLLNLIPSFSPGVTVELVAEMAIMAFIAYIYAAWFWDETENIGFDRSFSDYEKSIGK